MSTVAPTITSITTDKPSYNTGDTITVTMAYTAGQSSQGTTTTVTITGTATDQTTGETGSLTGNFTVTSPGTLAADPTSVSMADSDQRAYTKQSDDGSTAVFTAVA